MTTIRIVRPLFLVVMVACPIFSWTLFTAWGVTAAYVGSHMGGMASQGELEMARTKATWSFVSMIALQLSMLATSGFFVRSLTRDGQSQFWPSLKNWIAGVLLSVGVDALVFGVMIYRQVRW